MKKFFALVAAVMLSAVSFAQTEAGRFFIAPKAGYNAAIMTNLNDSYTSKTGLAAGVQLGYQVSEKFAVTADVLYSQQGAERKTTWKFDEPYTFESQFYNDYVNIPILANYYVIRGLAIKAGIQPGINISSKFTSESTDKPKTEADWKEVTNGVDFAIPVGVSYEFKNFILDARYVIGVTDVFKTGNKIPGPESYEDDANIESVKHGVFQLTLGYKLPL